MGREKYVALPGCRCGMLSLRSAIFSKSTGNLLNSSGLFVRKVGRRMTNDRSIQRFTLEERKEIYARPLARQFETVFAEGRVVVKKHLIKSSIAEDYPRVLAVAKALATDRQATVYLLPEINAREKALRTLLGLSADNGYTPDIMVEKGVFVDVKSPKIIDKLAHNAGKAARQSAVACITDHRLTLDVNHLDEYARRVFGNDAYDQKQVLFYISGHLYKKTKGLVLGLYGSPVSQTGFSGYISPHCKDNDFF